MEDAMKRATCFLISILALTVSVDALEVAYDFPPTTTDQLVHGLCAMGFESVSATSSFPNLKYDLVENFKDGTRLWPTDPLKQLHRDFVGKGGFCEGGTYIQPSRHQAINKGTKISVRGLSQPGVDAKLCYFVECDRQNHNRDGGWDELPGFEYVKRYQWDAERLSDQYYRGLGESKIYCKTFENADETVNVVRTAGGGAENVLEQDIKLNALHGPVEYPPGAVTIVSQDTKTVTVELSQAWVGTVDKYFYQYRTNAFSPTCFEKDAQEPNTVVDTITIQCEVTNPVATLELCIQDTTGSLLDYDAAVWGSVPKCCHSDAPLDTPTVCYMLEIDCGNNTERSLRGIAH